MDRKQVIRQLKAEGAKEVKNLTVKNVTVTVMDEYVRLGLTLDKEVEGMRQDENGEYQEDITNVIFASTFSIASILKDDEDAAFAANHLVENPKGFAVVLSRCHIDILQEKVAKDTEYVNPFAGEDAETTTFDHDVVINHISNIKLSKVGIKALDKLFDAILGI